jgi:outer membrane protein TolC
MNYANFMMTEIEIEQLRSERNTLRSTLAALVGTSDPVELEKLVAVIRLMPAPATDKAAMIDAIQVLLATQ